MSLLKERQKLILLADKSPYGWKTVLEYKHHDLAEDDEDEKKIYRAEARAARTSKRFAVRGSNSQRRGSSVVRSSQLAFGRLNPQVFAFLVRSQATGEPLAQICYFLPVRKINRRSD